MATVQAPPLVTDGGTGMGTGTGTRTETMAESVGIQAESVSIQPDVESQSEQIYKGLYECQRGKIKVIGDSQLVVEWNKAKNFHVIWNEEVPNTGGKGFILCRLDENQELDPVDEYAQYGGYVDDLEFGEFYIEFKGPPTKSSRCMKFLSKLADP